MIRELEMNFIYFSLNLISNAISSYIYPFQKQVQRDASTKYKLLSYGI